MGIDSMDPDPEIGSGCLVVLEPSVWARTYQLTFLLLCGCKAGWGWIPPLFLTWSQLLQITLQHHGPVGLERMETVAVAERGREGKLGLSPPLLGCCHLVTALRSIGVGAHGVAVELRPSGRHLRKGREVSFQGPLCPSCGAWGMGAYARKECIALFAANWKTLPTTNCNLPICPSHGLCCPFICLHVKKYCRGGG